jgi:hypothetical protein
MWTIALVLLGVAFVCAVAGFHIGPHAHALAGVFGLVASVWLALMAIDGSSTPLLWSVLGGDLVVAGGLGTLAWRGLTTSRRQASHRDLVGDLTKRELPRGCAGTGHSRVRSALGGVGRGRQFPRS